MEQKTFSIIMSIVLVFVATQGCTIQEVPVFSGDEKYVYFKRYITNDEGNSVRVDTAMMSFSHYMGIDEYTQEFYLGLVGHLTDNDLEYNVVVVKDKTTAEPGQYSLPEKLIFRKGQFEDILPITVYKDKIADGDERVLRLRLVESNDLKVAYSNPADSYTDIQFRFNNRISKPLWWNSDVRDIFFGDYSFKKYQTIIAANPGFNTVEGMNSAEIRRIALNTKEYIREHNITEDDGSEMRFPIY